MFGKRRSKRAREARRGLPPRPTPEPHARDARREERPRDEIRREDRSVDEASEDSFPASDPPSYTGTTGP